MATVAGWGGRRASRQGALCNDARRWSTFEQFRDQPESDFYQAPGRTPEETWHEVRDRVGLVTAEAAALALDDAVLVPATIRGWHRRIFETTFPETAGRFRTGRAPMTYGYVVGSKDAPTNRTGRGTGTRSLPRRVDKICKEFNQAAACAENGPDSPLIDATFPAARLYAKLLSAHPFDDGNGRTCYVALQFALLRLGAVAVSLPDYAEQQWHLGRALQTGGQQSYEPLAGYLAEKIRNAERKGLQSD
jgi:fido (protein-threonine AMPylation protein)